MSGSDCTAAAGWINHWAPFQRSTTDVASASPPRLSEPMATHRRTEARDTPVKSKNPCGPTLTRNRPITDHAFPSQRSDVGRSAGDIWSTREVQDFAEVHAMAP